MTDLDELIAEARESFSDATSGGDFDDWETLGRIVPRLADALEAATRVPVQGEPNDDREAKAEALAEWQDGNSMRQYSEWYTSWEDGYDAGRATVPDAATAGRLTQAELEDIAETHAFCADRLFIETELVDEIRAERDAAVAAVERVRVIHVDREYRTLDGTYIGGTVCDGCRRPFPCPTVAALDGAPEPEVKR